MSPYSKSVDRRFPDKRLEGDSELRQGQFVMLRLLKIFAAVCEELGLCYWIESGTLLGAVRHGGFIPWDDDVDVAMPREDYEIFLKKAPFVLPYDVYLDASKEYAKLQDRYGSRVPLDPSAPTEAIFIDIFPYRRFPRMRKVLARLLLLIPPYGIPDVPTDGSPQYLVYRHAVRIVAIVLRITGIKWLIKLLCLIGRRDRWSYDLTKTWHHHFNDDWIFPLQRIKFEDAEFFAPVDTDSLLKYQYGDYMVPPHESKRNHHGVGRILVTEPLDSPVSLSWETR